MTCCFFGHRDTTEEIMPRLEAEIRKLTDLIGVNDFLVGSQGNFDSMALSVLRKLKREHPEISYKIVLAYLLRPKNGYAAFAPSESIYPEGLESVPLRFAISKRNDWMLRQSDIVICYVRHHPGCSSHFVEKAIRQNKKIINLAE